VGIKMLSLSNIDLIETLRLFKNISLPVTFLVPTETAMNKSIMDATKEVREFFFDQGIHNFETQKQGEDSKILLNTTLFSKGEIIETKTSLYRPNTKQGDPRIWIYRLTEYADPTDLLAIINNKSEIVVINCSKSNLKQMLDIQNPTFNKFLSGSSVASSEVANELFSKLRDISDKGFVNTLRVGDTGIGYTLETLLRINANSSREPDYKGIEIKTSRKNKQKSGRTTIFSKTPNWNISRLKGSKDILYERGRFNERKKRIQLFHEFSAIKTNSYGMRLEIGEPYELLHQIYLEEKRVQKDVTWEIADLKDRLYKKHRETFWVTAETIGKSGDLNEKFRYSSITHTGNVDVGSFPILIELGVITLDYTIAEKSPGVAKDQGYLFKINSKDLNLLFTSVKHYDLS